MKSVFKTFILLTFVSLLFSGCATNRGVVNLEISEANPAAQSNGKAIFVRSVTDNRVFMEQPPSADIPSLGFGGAASASSDLKKRAIARKRNGFGKALGDILLDEGQTVESLVKDSLARSFNELGYEVIDDKEDIQTDTILIDASIEKFWSWMNPGFWAITLNSEIETKINVSNPHDEPKEIYVKSQGKYQVASGGNWIENMNKSLELYNDKVKEHFLQGNSK